MWSSPPTDSTYLTRLNILPDIHPHVAFIINPQMEERKVREKAGTCLILDFPLNETTIYPEYQKRIRPKLANIKRSIDLIKNDTNVSHFAY